MKVHDEHQWSVNLVRERYEYLSLTYEQAEKIYKYEQEKDTYSGKHFFSQWEEWDFELTAFRDILVGEQFVRYQNFRDERVDSYISSLVEQDNTRQNDILCKEELVNYYENRFLPDLRGNLIYNFSWLNGDKSKIEYLRMEYKQFLNDTKLEILTNHFRHNRSYSPNTLKASLLQHKLLCILPDYFYFQGKMDEPTKAVAQYLMNRIYKLTPETEDLLSRKFEELGDFINLNFKRYHCDIQGWLIFGRSTPDEEKINRKMRVLLIDKDRYGF